MQAGKTSWRGVLCCALRLRAGEAPGSLCPSWSFILVRSMDQNQFRFGESVIYDVAPRQLIGTRTKTKPPVHRITTSALQTKSFIHTHWSGSKAAPGLSSRNQPRCRRRRRQTQARWFNRPSSRARSCWRAGRPWWQTCCVATWGSSKSTSVGPQHMAAPMRRRSCCLVGMHVLRLLLSTCRRDRGAGRIGCGRWRGHGRERGGRHLGKKGAHRTGVCDAGERVPSMRNACMQRQPGVGSAHTQQACAFKSCTNIVWCMLECAGRPCVPARMACPSSQ